ncbi:MAG: hypothetical protein LBU34_13635 [Planctomycetaceae bacterium]|jgi:hypothetical protein|nr:hypothetical protein [Planctomycetaceae bacterium]
MRYKNFKQLLDGYYYPVTKRYSFMATSFEDVVTEYWGWICNNPYFKNAQEYYLEPRFIDCSLREGLDILDPIGYNQILFCETRSKWTACFVSDGSELGISSMAYSLNCQGVEVTLIEDTYDRKTDSGLHGCTRLRVIRDARRTKFTDNTERLLYVSKLDGGRWGFCSLGEPYSFENVECYTNPKITERFTPQMLNTYLNAMGIDVLDENFYCYKKALIDYKIKSPDSIYEKRTYASYHLERRLKYGRE